MLSCFALLLPGRRHLAPSCDFLTHPPAPLNTPCALWKLPAADGEKECFLKNDPRETPKGLETLIATYDASLQGLLPSPLPEANETAAVTTTVLAESSKDKGGGRAGGLPLLQPSPRMYADGEAGAGVSDGDNTIRYLTTAHATEVFRVSFFCFFFSPGHYASLRKNWQERGGLGREGRREEDWRKRVGGRGRSESLPHTSDKSSTDHTDHSYVMI